MSDGHGDHGGGHGGHGEHGGGHGGGSKEWVGRLVAVGLVLLGIWIVVDIIGALNRGYERAISGIPVASVEPKVSAMCDGLKRTVTYGREPIEVNPNGQCQLDLWYTQCIYVQQYQSNIPRQVCPAGTHATLPNDIQFVWSAGEPFTGSYERHGPKFTKLFEFRE